MIKPMKTIECKCGKDFEREDKLFESSNISILSKWKRIYCDKCLEQKVEIVFKRLPDILNCIIEED